MPNSANKKKKTKSTKKPAQKRNVKKLSTRNVYRPTGALAPIVANIGRTGVTVSRFAGSQPGPRHGALSAVPQLRDDDPDNSTIYTNKGRLSGMHDQSGIMFTREDLYDATTQRGKPRTLQWTIPINIDQTLSGNPITTTDSRGSFIRLNSFTVLFTNKYPIEILLLVQVPVALLMKQDTVYTKLGAQKRTLKPGESFRYIRHAEHSLSDQYVPPMMAVEDPENVGLKTLVADLLEFKIVPAKGEPAGIDFQAEDEMLEITFGAGRKGKDGIAYTVGSYPSKGEKIIRREKKVCWPQLSEDAFDYVPAVNLNEITPAGGLRDDAGIGWTCVDRAPQHDSHDYYTVHPMDAPGSNNKYLQLVSHSDGQHFSPLEMEGFDEDTRFYPPFSMTWLRGYIETYEWTSCTPCGFKLAKHIGAIVLWDEGNDAPYIFCNDGTGNTGRPDCSVMPSGSHWGVQIGTPIRCVYFDATRVDRINPQMLKRLGGAAYAAKILANAPNHMLVRRAAYREQLRCLALGHSHTIKVTDTNFWEFATTALTIAAMFFL